MKIQVQFIENQMTCELFVSKQWFGVRIKLPKSRDFSKQGFITSLLFWNVSKFQRFYMGGGGGVISVNR